jgi:hypothetical protein
MHSTTRVTGYRKWRMPAGLHLHPSSRRISVMRTVFLCLSVLVMILWVPVKAQQQFEDVIHFKNGGIIRGTILEQVPNKTVKIQTREGNILVFDFSQIARITREPVYARTRRQVAHGTHFEFTVLAGGAIYDGFYAGVGVRAGVSLGPGVYLGAVIVNHFTDLVNISYAGGEIGYTARLQSLSVQPYVSAGVGFGGGEAAFYVGPGLGVYVWPVPQLGIGPDIKYAYVPDLEDGFGGIYLGVTYRL